MMIPEVKGVIEEDRMGKHVTFTGIVPQGDGPKYLAACDIFSSPHVPNPDGSPFFGSPTKLFEYMAMGKGIVASKLEQIGEVLQNEQNALLVTPGDVGELTEGILRLADDKRLRERLGEKAREDVIANYTWEKNTERVIDRLKALR